MQVNKFPSVAHKDRHLSYWFLFSSIDYIHLHHT